MAGSNVVRFLLYVAGVRDAATSVSPSEHELLRRLAAGKRCVVEVGVHEGATSRVLAQAIGPGGKLFLVDPFPLETMFERFLGLSFAGWIARRELAAQRGVDARFVRLTSEDAARALPLDGAVDVVFIDARHDYESARQDFLLWQQKLAPDGAVAFHDSRPCHTRPDVDERTGVVRFVDELLRGQYGAWRMVDGADTIVAVRRH